MKKVISGVILIIVIVIAASVYYLLTNLDTLIEAAIEKYGSEATQTSVLVDSVKTDLGNGAVAISGLTVGNPDGYELPNAFSLGEIRVGIDLESLQEEPYIINEITVLAPQVFVEISEDNKTNLNDLMNNLTAGSKGSTQNEKPQQADGSAKEPRLIIRRVKFADGAIQAKVAALKDKEYKLKLPNFDMRNLGGSKGATPSEIANEILKHLTDRASDVVKRKIIDAELNKLKEKAQKKVDEEKAKLQEKFDSKLDAEKDKIKDKLNNLFSR
ncbi:MAG: hypothetical protein OEY61_11070 [Gammaproteobacteria bacterium]|nr:hypothetical protein [Gammaproteobacteria bacterium]